MIYRISADLVLILHLGFVLYAIFGGMLVFRWGWTAYVHIPAAVWGVTVEVMGWICPLTPMEISLRQAAGGMGYSGGFVDQYLLPVLYPANLARPTQWLLGASLLVFNVIVYALVLHRRSKAG